MEKSFRSFMGEIIDYAGLFPPASLDLNQAFSNYIKYQYCEERWMLARFICPAAKLPEITNRFASQILSAQLTRLSILASPPKADITLLETFRIDLEQIIKFRDTFGEKIALEGIELKIPESILNNQSQSEYLKYIQAVDSAVREASFPGTQLFFETNLKTDVDIRTEVLSNSLAEFNSADDNVPDSGFKLRCGGVTADAFPTIETVAKVIHAVVDHDVPFKGTAGLHHPIKRFNESVDTKMHGFLNVFGALLLAKVNQLSTTEISEILDDEAPSNFKFEGDTFRWKNLSIDVNVIAELRDSKITSFGSCSFDEPREDLAELGWLKG